MFWLFFCFFWSKCDPADPLTVLDALYIDLCSYAGNNGDRFQSGVFGLENSGFWVWSVNDGAKDKFEPRSEVGVLC